MQNKIITQSLSTLRIIFISSLTIFTLYSVQAWTQPSSTPPNGNVSGPITTSGVDQIKLGSLSVASLLDSNDPTNFFLNPNGDSKLFRIFMGSAASSISSPKFCMSTNETSCITAWPTGGTVNNYPTAGVSSITANSGITVSPVSPATGAVTLTADTAVLQKKIAATTCASGISSIDGNGVVTCAAAAGIPVGAVMYFNLASCPAGWLAANGTSASPDLRGEFIRGLDSGRGVDIGRALASAQVDMFKSHTHTVPMGNQTSAALGGIPAIVPGGVSTNPNTGSTGGTETRPRNVALLACVKS